MENFNSNKEKMNLQEVSNEIKEILEEKRKELSLSFIEEEHIYFMKDKDGIIKSNFPSVSKVIKKFHPHFDAESKALQMANGDPEGQQELLNEWKKSSLLSTNLGSRTHFILEKNLIEQYGNYKELRQPIFTVNDEQILRSDNMILAGNNFINLMHERNCVLLDTEMVLGHYDLGYTGQPDKVWLLSDKNGEPSLCITDWKTNKPENFLPKWFTKKMYKPFNNLDDTALSHYYVQLPLYGRLILKMLEGTKYENIKLLGCIVVLLKDDATFEEYRIPKSIIETVFNLDIGFYLESKKYSFVD